MKKIYTLLSALTFIGSSFAQNGQIQNGGFENWSNTTIFDYTVEWGCSNMDQFQGVATVLKSTDAQLGTYSAELIAAEVGSNPDTTFGYVFHGTIGGSGPDGGIPYTDVFNTVKFQYKNDLPIGDTLYLLAIRYTGGTMTSMDIIPAAFGSHSSWTQGSVVVPNGTQTELFIAFIIGNPFIDDRPTPGVWARVDNVQMFNNSTAVTNLPDPSFESWLAQTTETPDSWNSLNEMFASGGFENANKTVDANTGVYAIELTTIEIPDNGDIVPGLISWGPIDPNNGGNPFSAAPYNATPTTFSGTYKYAPVNADQANIQIIFYNAGLVVGSHTENFTAQNAYTTFSSALTISSQPDSILFVAMSGNEIGSILKLDDLSFSGGNVGLEEFEKFSVSIYPNPATDVVMVKSAGTYSVEIVDLTGKTVCTETNLEGAKSINVSTMKSGTYLVRINNQNGIEVHQLVIQ